MSLTPVAIEVLTTMLRTQGRSFVVIRGTDDYRLEGRWIDLDDPFKLNRVVTRGEVVLEPTGEIERRDDGMLAAVVRPRRVGESER